MTPGNTDNAVNRLARKQLHLHHVVSERTKGGIKQYIELEKHNLDQIICKQHKNVSKQTYSFLEVKLRRLRRKTYEDKYDIREKNLHTVLARSFNQTAGPSVIWEILFDFIFNFSYSVQSSFVAKQTIITFGAANGGKIAPDVDGQIDFSSTQN